MRQLSRAFHWPSLCLVVVVLSACASLPPVKPVTSVGQIAGKWQGTGSGPTGMAALTTTINPDGSYTAATANQTFTGKITVVDGKLRGRADQTGNMGTWMLHEGDGKRVLVYRSDDGRTGLELTPAR